MFGQPPLNMSGLPKRSVLMKKVSLIARLLLGLIFLVFGLNGFFHFIPMPPPQGLAAQFMGALYASHILSIVMALQLLGGVLLLSGRFTPLALLVLAPIIANILLFHLFIEPSGLPLAVVLLLLWIGTAWGVRSVLAPALRPNTQPEVNA
jgi:putative oxidoreductase